MKSCDKSHKFAEKNMIIDALSANLKKNIDKQGRETAEKTILITTVKQLKAARVSDSTAIGQLQKLVNRFTLSAAIIKNKTSGHLTGTKPTVTYENFTDTLTKFVKTDSCNPVFQDTLIDRWTEIQIFACKDSITANYTVHNEYQYSQKLGAKQGKWPFRYRHPVVSIKNMNPHTTTQEITAWTVSTPNTKKKATLAAASALLSGFILGVFLIK
jgi:hypothetical protein